MQRAASASEAAPGTAQEGAAQEAAAGGAGGEAGPPPAKKAKKSVPAGQEGKANEDVEPDWSLPPELEEYRSGQEFQAWTTAGALAVLQVLLSHKHLCVWLVPCSFKGVMRVCGWHT
jgi:hypothetical protein